MDARRAEVRVTSLFASALRCGVYRDAGYVLGSALDVQSQDPLQQHLDSNRNRVGGGGEGGGIRGRERVPGGRKRERFCVCMCVSGWV